jgi:hypothetical protein
LPLDFFGRFARASSEIAATLVNMQAAPLTPSGIPTPSAQQARPIARATAGTDISPHAASSGGITE